MRSLGRLFGVYLVSPLFIITMPLRSLSLSSLCKDGDEDRVRRFGGTVNADER